MNILDYNHCTAKTCRHSPKCGWNLFLGGTSEEELEKLKSFLMGLIENDLTEYHKKLGTERFLSTESPS